MTGGISIRTIENDGDIVEGLAHLAQADPLIARVRAGVAHVPLRRQPAGFDALIRIIIGQQVSVAAAASMFARLEARMKPLSPDRLARTRETTLRNCGLSGPKIKAIRAIAKAVRGGALNLDDLAQMQAEDAHAALCTVHGIGPWSADIYLLFCLGHPDIFPVGDLALQIAVQDAMCLKERPNSKVLAEIAARWRPWRGVAARLFWAHYAAHKRPKSGVPV